VVLPAFPRGFHLITDRLLAAVDDLAAVRVGVLHVFVHHSSASLCINENADPDVRGDLERWCRHVAPDASDYFDHVLEGADDMPAHVKGAVFGPSLTIPVVDGRLDLGTWQGVYLGEHRQRGGRRRVSLVLHGETA
jgi:secondary thiamine-phosphate synthase enzyme